MRTDAEHPSIAARAARGRAARAEAPRSRHALWEPPTDRPDPVALLEAQARTRAQALVPIRHGRMRVSPFSYFRGAALARAGDLSAATPVSGINVQVRGDAHLSNFGIFCSPGRRLFFDVNDFDETACGPWEWDVKRLASSLEIAGRESGFTRKQRVRIVSRTVRTYRETMRELAMLPVLGVWHAHLDVDALLPRFRSLLNVKKTPRVWKSISKARAHDSDRAFSKLCCIRESELSNHGHRVVAGQRLMQAAGDIFLGWERFDWGADTRDYYIRQLRDWKGSADTEGMTAAGMKLWGSMCAWTLARGHARSGDRVAIAAYLGTSDVFDRAIAAFAAAYADQNERDYQSLKSAVASGRLEAHVGI